MHREQVMLQLAKMEISRDHSIFKAMFQMKLPQTWWIGGHDKFDVLKGL